MTLLYHGAWLVYDVLHLNRPWDLFFVAMSLLAIVRALRWYRRPRKGGWF